MSLANAVSSWRDTTRGLRSDSTAAQRCRVREAHKAGVGLTAPRAFTHSALRTLCTRRPTLWTPRRPAGCCTCPAWTFGPAAPRRPAAGPQSGGPRSPWGGEGRQAAATAVRWVWHSLQRPVCVLLAARRGFPTRVTWRWTWHCTAPSLSQFAAAMSLYDTLSDYSDAFLAKAKVRGASAARCLPRLLSSRVNLTPPPPTHPPPPAHAPGGLPRRLHPPHHHPGHAHRAPAEPGAAAGPPVRAPYAGGRRDTHLGAVPLA